jgi:replication-associated recombination protein RarA
MPDSVAPERFYEPTDRGFEAELAERLERIRRIREGGSGD